MKIGEGEVCESERGAFRVGGDNVGTVAAVVGKGRTKNEAVVGTGESEAELAGGMKWVGGEVVWKAVKTRPGREGRIRAPRAERVEGDFGVGKKAVPYKQTRRYACGRQRVAKNSTRWRDTTI